MLNRRLSLLLWNAAMPRLKPATRDIGIDRLQAEQSQTEDCRQFNQSTFSRHRKRLSHTVSAQNLHRSDRPRITTPAQNRYIRIFYLRNHCCWCQGLRKIFTWTVRIRLRQHGIRSRRPYLGAVLTQVHRRARVR